jgi:proteasome lid subunit RPN8/RPN11
MKPSLDIAEKIMDRILCAAREAGSDECMGLLASSPGDGPVTHSHPLEADASTARAEADPLEMKRAAGELRSLGLVPRGLWHSHGEGRVFHSGTDHDTMRTLLPAMAAWNFERSKPAASAPVVTGPDTAVLPLPDGRARVLTLRGPWIADLGAYAPVEWAGIRVRFGAGERRAVVEDGAVLLEGGGVTLELGIPEGASVDCAKADPAGTRVAKLYSLVVNARGEAVAERLVVTELGAETLFDQRECGVFAVAADGTRLEVELPKRLLARLAHW